MFGKLIDQFKKAFSGVSAAHTSKVTTFAASGDTGAHLDDKDNSADPWVVVNETESSRTFGRLRGHLVFIYSLWNVSDKINGVNLAHKQ